MKDWISQRDLVRCSRRTHVLGTILNVKTTCVGAATLDHTRPRVSYSRAIMHLYYKYRGSRWIFFTLFVPMKNTVFVVVFPHFLFLCRALSYRMVWFLHCGDKVRLNCFFCRCRKLGYSDRSVTFEDMCAEADEQLLADLLTIHIMYHRL